METKAPPVKLIEVILTRLPRELRDHIYSFVWDSETVQSLEYPSLYPLANVKCMGLSNPGHEAYCICSKDFPYKLPPFTRPKFVGYLFAREIVQSLYATGRNIEVVHSALIDRFLHRDVFHLGVTPASVNLRELRVKISVNERDWPRNLNAHFQPLVTARLGRNFRLLVQLTILRNPIESNLMADIGRRLQHAVTQLELKGARVSIRWERSRKPAVELRQLIGAEQQQWAEFMEHY